MPAEPTISRTQTLPRATESPQEDLPRTIGFWGGSAIMVGIIIGSGIFRAPTTISKEVGSPYLILLLWLVGGIVSLFGAFAYAELGAMFPRSGGIYVYISEGLGHGLAFIFGWTYMILVKPLAAGAISMVFSEHLNHLLGTHWDPRIMACVILLTLTAINTMGVGIGANMAIVLTGLKAAVLIAIVVLAVGMSQGDAANFASVAAPRSLLVALAPALAAILWTYDGWSDVASVSGEVRDPQRLLPRIFVTGTAASIGLFVAVNAVYIWMIGLEPMRDVVTVAPIVMERLLGRWSDRVLTLVVLTSTLGATHCSVITGARIMFAQARDGLTFKPLGRIHPRFQTPDVALWVQGSLSSLAVLLLKDFDALTSGFVFMMWIFYGAACVSLIVLRFRRPELHRSYRCFGYPFVPLIFILCAIAMTVLAIIESPQKRLAWLATMLAGIPMFYIWTALRKRQAT